METNFTIFERIYVYIYMYILEIVFHEIVFHALYIIMYFGRSKCEASAEHGVVLHQSKYSKGFNVAAFTKTQAENSGLNSALQGLAWIVFGSRLH